MKGILDFFDIMPSSGFDVPAQEAIDRFQAKGLKTSFAWQDVMRDEHKSAFTIAKMMDMDMLADVKESLDDALANGVVFRDWADNLIPMLQQKGWWGRQTMLDPLTGETIIAQLGSPGRLKTIFRTNMASAYAAGHWDQIEAQADDAPYLLYDAIDDYRTRPAHKAWDGKVLPITDTFWKFHTPPCGYNCRCSVIQLDDSDLEQLGVAPGKSPKTEYYDWINPRTGKTIKVPNGVDPGFGHAASSRIDDLRKLATEKAKALPTKPMVDAATKALAEMDKALADKTPYLSTAIKSLQAKSPELGPVQMLAEAQAKAAKAKQSAWLSEYKGSLQAGKNPSASAQKAFDSLPQEAQLALLKDIEQKNALLKANADATAKLDEFKAATPTSAQGKALAAMQKAGELDGLSVIEQAAKLEAKLVEVKQQANLSSMISGYKAKVIAGKIPTEAQSAAFKSLPEADQQKALADIDKKKAKAAPPEPPVASPAATQDAIAPQPAPAQAATAISGENLVQIGPQKGSNPGGLFQDTETGEKWYVKWPDSIEQARNELLTAKLYQLGGIDAPDYRFVAMDGKRGIASRWIEGLEKDQDALIKGASGVAEGFGMDAWLANWDVIGQGYDNMLVQGAKAFRVDTGGGLLYRAQGAKKGDAFGNTVTEIDTLRQQAKNAQAARVFNGLTDAQIENSVRRVLALKDGDIERLVEEFGPRDIAERVKLAETLIARKNYLADRFPSAMPKPRLDTELTGITSFEVEAIHAARVNGYTVHIDEGSIEDHNVRITQRKGTDGRDKYMVTLKLTEQALKGIRQANNTAGIEISALKSKLSETFKGIGALARDGEVYRQKDFDRLTESSRMLREAIEDINKRGGPEAKKLLPTLEEMLDTARGILNTANVGEKAQPLAKFFKLDELPSSLAVAGKESAGPAWTKFSNADLKAAEIKKSHIRDADKRLSLYGNEGHEAVIDGVKVRVFDSGMLYNQGYTMFEVIDPKAVQSIIDKMGIKSARTAALQRDELLANAMASRRFVSKPAKRTKFAELESITDTAERTAKKLDMISKDAGFDITKTETWRNREARQAFDHGRAMQLRPDLDTPEMKEWSDKHLLYHSVGTLSKTGNNSSTLWEDYFVPIFEGGGSLTSLLDRLRRGLGMTGQSDGKDFRDGGGAYVFTRIKTRGGSGYYSNSSPGIYWRPHKHITRADRLTYSGDQFGDVTPSGQSKHVDLVHTKDFGSMGSDETIFKDGLSLFDDLEMIVLPSEAQRQRAIKWLRNNNIPEWPDGRTLEQVIKAGK